MGTPAADDAAGHRGAGRLDGKVALVTGGAGDIGIAIALRFAREGARVALLDLRLVELEARVAGLTEGGVTMAQDRLVVLGCDIADPQQVEDAVAEVAARWRQLDILVNNAATETPASPVAGIAIEDWRRTLDVNLTGAWLMCRSCLPLMIASGGGVVINVASQLGHVAASGRGAYGVSKAGLIALARAIAVDHAGDGIRANSISPGAIMTRRLTDRYGSQEAVARRLSPRYLTGRIGIADDVAAAAAFLASDEASFVTGSDLLADGGYTAV
jgi:NAD(P)-dependent dehydrogenase (short-subunit alcohol dehydrogenase family)